jgi:hypothetical protein
MGFDNLEFSLRYTVSDKIERKQIRFTIYDGLECQEGSNKTFVLGYPYLNSGIAVSPSRYPNHKDATVFVKIRQQEISDSPIFHQYSNDDNSTDATIAFCVRFALYTETDANNNQTAVEVNFLETPVVLDVTLHDGLYIHLKGEIVNRQLAQSHAAIGEKQDYAGLRGTSYSNFDKNAGHR